MSDDRGQVFTLEAFVAALVVLAAVVFALQITSATPLSASASSQHVENQEAALASSLLETAIANGSLETTLLHWNEQNASFEGASPKGYYQTCSFDTTFGRMLARTFEDRGMTCNVNVRYVGGDAQVHTLRVVHVGEPTDTAVRRTILVSLYDDDRLTPSNRRLSNTTASSFYAYSDASPSDLHQVVQVEVVVWRV